MDGLLVVDKPAGPTSHDVVARMRRVLRERRIGHTGTLDPGASGVLPLVVGRATRLAQFMSGADKVYEATVRLGQRTDSFDAQGSVVGERFEGQLPEAGEIESALVEFRGTYLQQPPAFSAKKIGGRRSYALARAARSQTSESDSDVRLGSQTSESDLGVRLGSQTSQSDSEVRLGRQTSESDSEVRLASPTLVTAFTVELLSLDGADVRLRIHCSAGFYVRSLANDLGNRLGTGAHLVALRRTRCGDHDLGDAIALDVAEQDPDAARRQLLPLGRLLVTLDAVVLSAAGVRRATHGCDLSAGDLASGAAFAAQNRWTPDKPIRLLAESGDLVGVGHAVIGRDLLHPSVILG